MGKVNVKKKKSGLKKIFKFVAVILLGKMIIEKALVKKNKAE